MPKLPEGRFIEAVKEVVKANKDFVPPYGHGAKPLCSSLHDGYKLRYRCKTSR